MKYIYYAYLAIICLSCTTKESQVDAFGNFESNEIFISSEANGKLIAVNFEEGANVSKGDILAIVDTTQLYLKKEQIKASMKSLNAKLQNIPAQLNVYYQQQTVLGKELNRIKQLKENGVATQKQYDDLEGELAIIGKKKMAIESQLSVGNRSILSEMEPLNWQLMQLEDAIEKSICKAPISGTVLSKFKSFGEIVGQGQTLLKMADLENMTVRMYVSGSQLNGLLLGGEVSVNIDGQNGEFISYPGKIKWISAMAEFTPKTIQTKEERVNQVYAVKATVQNDGKIKIGMPAEIIFN